MAVDPIMPDTKDWTWTTRERCGECGVDVSTVPATVVPRAVVPLTEPWARVLTQPGVRERPRPDQWSPLEYACHVSDVLAVFTERFRLVQGQDSASLPDWDQDRAAIEGDYGGADPVEVGRVIPDRAAALEQVLGQYAGADWDTPIQRSDGADFTALGLGRYLLHDLAHHLVDVGEPVPQGLASTTGEGTAPPVESPTTASDDNT